MGNRGLSSRAVLISLAAVAIGVVVALLALSDSGPSHRPGSSTESAAESKDDVRAPLEATERSDAARANAPESVAPETKSSVRTRTLVVSGTVIDARSRAVVPAVDIEAFAEPLPGGKEARAKTQSDAKGRYSLELAIPADLAPDVWGMRVLAQGERFQDVNQSLVGADFRPQATNPDASVAILDLEIELLLVWRGRLVRESDGTPIAGGTATLLGLAPPPAAPRSLAESQTDETGRFLIRGGTFEASELAVMGTAEGCLAKMVPVALDPGKTFDVGTISLGEGACVEGLVTTSSGSAPAATEVIASTMARGDEWMFLRSGAWAVRNGVLVPRDARGPIGPDGRFRLCGLAPDEYYLTVSYLGCATGSDLEFLEVEAPASGVRMQLSRAVYRLSVRDARSGEVIQGSRFLFEGAEDFACNLEEKYVIATDPGIESPGTIVADGYRALKCSLPAIGASETRDLEFRLESLSGQVGCTIVVMSPEGAPVDEIEVEIRSGEGEIEGQGPIPRLSHFAADGRHELPKLVPGSYYVWIEPRRDGVPAAEMWLGTELELLVREDMAPVEVRLEEGGLVQATVTRKGGEPIDARTFLVRTPDGEPEPIDWRNGDGSFVGWIPKQSSAHLDRPLPAGAWTLRFDADGCAIQDVVVEVDAGRTTAITVVLEAESPR